MTHPRDAVVGDLVQAVTGLTTTGDRVHLEPPEPIEKLPAGVAAELAVVPVNEPVSDLSHGSAPTQRRELTALVVTYARTSEVRSQSCVEIERALLGMRTPKRRVVLESVELGRHKKGDQLFVAGHRIRIPYLMAGGSEA